jgi:oligoribonuclease (3'-5' exoribonuclease)
MTVLCFTDLETLGLDPLEHDVWEIAIIARDEDGVETEHLWQRRPSPVALARAEPKALEMGRFHERMAVPGSAWAADMLDNIGDGHTPVPMSLGALNNRVAEILKDAVMVGSNPAFDASFLTVMLGMAPWHYRTVDVATLAAGYLHGSLTAKAGGDRSLFLDSYPTLPYSSYALSERMGIAPPSPEVAHTALGDARWAKAVFDAATGGGDR